MQLPSESAVTLRDDWDVNDLASYLRRSQRSRITVVVSVPQQQAKPPVDAGELKRRLGAKADVVVVPAALTFKLTDALGRTGSVFGGAARMYPCDDGWLSDQYRTELIHPKGSPNSTLGAIEQAVAHELRRMDEHERRWREATTASAHTVPANVSSAAHTQATAQSSTAHPAPAGTGIAGAAGAEDAGTGAGGTMPVETGIADTGAARTETAGTGKGKGRAKISRKARKAADRIGKTSPATVPAGAPIQLDLPRNGAGVFIADTAARAATLAGYLCSPQSSMPVVIATRNVGMATALADTEELAKMLRGAAHVVDVIGSDATSELNARMPKGVQTFGNACRVIPAGSDWVKHGGVKLFWGWTMGDRGRITDAVLQEAARLSFSNSYSTNMAVGSKRAVSGTVMGSPAEGRVLVSLGRGLYATILTTLVTKDVPGDRLFTKGMAVTGLFDEDSRRLDLTAPRPREAREALAGYASGMVVPARVTAVRRDSCTLELFPGAVVEVPAEDAGLGADLRWELTVGAVVPVAVIERDDGEDAWSDVDANGNVRLHWLMSLLDADGTVSPAPSYFPGGPAWIAIPDASEAAVRQPEQRELATVDERQLAALIPDSADTASAQRIRDLYAQLVQTRQELVAAERQRDATAAQLEQAKQRALEHRRSMRQQSRHRSAAGVNLQGRFADPRQQLDFEVYMAWVTRIPAAEKADKPFKRDWAYGPDFFASLEAVQGVDREKVAHVMLEVVLGLDRELASRGLHQLRTGEGGGDPKRRTAAGDTYWRVYLQTNTPSARRLHYVRRADGSVVFMRVGLHDDFRG